MGNARISFGRKGAGTLEITDTNNYYPFGLNPIGGDTSGELGRYKNYTLQGQELQETGFYSFKWRQYMPDVGRFFNIDTLSEKYSYQSHYNFAENRVVDGRELEGLEWSKSTDGKTIHIHGIIRNQSSYTGDIKPIAEEIKSANEKAYSVGGVKATFSYELNQNADPSKQYVFTLSNPLETKVTLKTDDKGNVLGYDKVTKAGEAILNSPTVNEISIGITNGKNDNSLKDLSAIGQVSVHENGHGAGLDHSWQKKKSGVAMDKASQEVNAMNSGQRESSFPVSDASNMTITPQQIQNILKNPKIPEK